MTRSLLPVIGFVLVGVGEPGTATAQAETSATDVDCSTFLAMDDGQMNAVAAAVEMALDAETPPAAPDPDVLRAAGIDPAGFVPPPPPMPGETRRVLTEACAATGADNVIDALTPVENDQPAVPASAAVPTDG